MAISKVTISDTTHDIVAGGITYCTCATAAETAAKVATVVSGNFSLFTGAIINVKFTNSNSVASPTLNVANTGAKAIYWHGSALTSSQYWEANSVLVFIYNGNQWDLVSVAKDNNTTYGVATSSKLGLVKSGTDITVDTNGNVSVNDDSHNHVISNIDNLQSTLDAKVPTSRTVNGKALSANITLSASDVGAVPTLTYEWNKQLACGSNGLVCLGKFPCYDTNITIDIDSTTSTTYHGTLVIAAQNINTTGGGSLKATVYGDATGTLSSVIKIQYGSGSNVVSVYCSFPGWSKNLVYVRAVNLTSQASDVLTSVTSIPTEANRTATNALDAKYLLKSGGTITGSSGDTPLKVKSASTGSYIGFVNTSGATMGYFGYNAANSPVVYNDKAYKIYHEGNKPKASDVGAVNITVSSTQPTNQSVGDFWYKVV